MAPLPRSVLLAMSEKVMGSRRLAGQSGLYPPDFWSED
jgi:hypothetical protein